jgi:hypothetical protein
MGLYFACKVMDNTYFLVIVSHSMHNFQSKGKVTVVQKILCSLNCKSMLAVR